jgi:hypothetical protein
MKIRRVRVRTIVWVMVPQTTGSVMSKDAKAPKGFRQQSLVLDLI